MVLKYFKQKPLTEIRKVWFYRGFTYIIYKVTIVEELVVGSKFGICKARILQLLYCWQILLVVSTHLR